MKKIFIAIIAVAAMSFASCGNSTKQGGENDTIDTAVVEEDGVAEAQTKAEEIVAGLMEKLEANDATSLSEKVAEAKAYVEELIGQGKLEAAKIYAEKIQGFIDANKDKLEAISANGTETISSLLSAVTALPTSASEALNGAAEAATESANEAVENVKDAAANAVNNAKSAVEDKANEAVENAKSKANEAVENAKSKAGEAVDNAAKDVKKSLGL